MKNKTLVVGSVVLAIAFVAIAFVYWLVPAGNLPAFMPGYMAGSAAVHIKHGIGAIVIALALAALAWFKSAPASDAPMKS